MKEYCAISCWEYKAGRVVVYCRLKPRGPEALAFVQAMMRSQMSDIEVDTVKDGVFRIYTHGQEFLDWCQSV